MFATMLLIGIATAFNFIVVIYKLRRSRTTDAIVDVSLTALMGFMFAGTMAGMAIAMVSSFILSLYLWFNPIRLYLPSLPAWSYKALVILGIIALVLAGNLGALYLVRVF